jgi:hypothetical protein
MKKNWIIMSMAALITGSIFFTSCQRERDTDVSEGEETVLFERAGDDVYAITDQASTGDLAQYRSCATIIHDTLNTPHVLTVDFGTTNCLCADGKLRRGKIITTYTGPFKQAGTVRTTTYDDYFVNDHQLKGIKIVTNNGLNSNNNPSWTIDTKDTIIKANNGGTVTWQSIRNREKIAGSSTPMWTDDKYSITGNGSGVKANGNNWSMTISNPLIIDHNCVFRIISGTIQFQPQGKVLRTLDYGNGTCDNDATVTINNKIFNIKFK